MRQVLYNDASPQENHHVAGAFALMLQPELNFAQQAPKKVFEGLRRRVIEMVLATDMKQVRGRLGVRACVCHEKQQAHLGFTC